MNTALQDENGFIVYDENGAPIDFVIRNVVWDHNGRGKGDLFIVPAQPIRFTAPPGAIRINVVR